MIETEAVLRVLLVFVRVGGLLVAAPFFGREFVAVPVKVMLAALLAFVLAGFASGPLPGGVTHPLGFAVAVSVEAGTGVLLGFAARVVFFAVQTAGEILGFQMSLGLAQAYDPMGGGNANPLGRMMALSFLLVFLLLGGPHHLVHALTASFEVVPLGGARLGAGGALLIGWMGDFFVTAIRLSAPFMVTMLLLDSALGIFARVVPQADLFSMSLPAKLLLGLGAFYVFAQGFMAFAPALIDQMVAHLAELVRVLAG